MEYLPYILDLIVMIVIVGSGIIAYRKGFVTAALHFLPMVVGLIATKLLTPTVSQLLRKTPFFDSLSTKISDNLQLDAVVGDAAMQTQTEIINNMKLPDFLKDTLLENNNPVIYNLLDVESLQNYVAGFFGKYLYQYHQCIIGIYCGLDIDAYVVKSLEFNQQTACFKFFQSDRWYVDWLAERNQYSMGMLYHIDIFPVQRPVCRIFYSTQ